jgi:AcrR family transcriptional regulator
MVNIVAKRKKDESTQERILTAAKKVFVSQGLMGARMQDIADEAGINKALLHYYFKNKEQLFETIFKEASSRLFPRINQIFSSDEPLFEKIEKFVDEYITVTLENPYLPLFVLNEINRDPKFFLEKVWLSSEKPRPEKFLEQISREVAKGTIRDVSPLQLLMNLISLTIFPFVAKPMFQINLGLDEFQFRHIMEQRRKEIPRVIIESIRK